MTDRVEDGQVCEVVVERVVVGSPPTA